ncbi:unnamed protein product [Medioppia subpectinata]|uniref:Uncharacterized protein n=1 Tax=Medioppia subpectinata TaxID=1979941 RepID=A0A7R9KTZ3_9ACAR|nr:unnamed protein product [Medioppia subpectinata]CAG2109477.1 unnamed protein product [Medioppia subpectinata]
MFAVDNANTSRVAVVGRRGRSVEIGGAQTSSTQSPNHLNDTKAIASTSLQPQPSTSKVTHSPHMMSGAASSAVNIGSKSGKLNESNRSSLSSEGFCETENETFDEAMAPIESTSKLPEAVRSAAAVVNAVLRDSSSDSTDMIADENGSDLSADCGVSVNPLDANSNAVNNAPPVDRAVAKEVNEYELYYYDPKANENKNGNSLTVKIQALKTAKVDENESVSVVVNKIEDPIEVLFARAEALHAHGRTLEACLLAVKLAEELLSNPPNLLIETPSPPARGKRNRRFNPVCHQVSLLVSATLSIRRKNTSHNPLLRLIVMDRKAHPDKPDL